MGEAKPGQGAGQVRTRRHGEGELGGIAGQGPRSERVRRDDHQLAGLVVANKNDKDIIGRGSGGWLKGEGERRPRREFLGCSEVAAHRRFGQLTADLKEQVHHGSTTGLHAVDPSRSVEHEHERIRMVVANHERRTPLAKVSPTARRSSCLGTMMATDRWVRALIEDRESVGKFLLGGVLMFFPVVNFVVLGYLYRYARQVRRQGEYHLPGWEDWWGLFVDGLRLLGVVLVFCGVPLVAGWMVKRAVLMVLGWAPVGMLAELPLAVALFFGPILAFCALYRLQRADEPQDLLRLDALLNMLRSAGLSLVAPGLIFMGLVLGFRSVYGLSIFAGSLFLIAELTTIFVTLERSRR